MAPVRSPATAAYFAACLPAYVVRKVGWADGEGPEVKGVVEGAGDLGVGGDDVVCAGDGQVVAVVAGSGVADQGERAAGEGDGGGGERSGFDGAEGGGAGDRDRAGDGI